MKKKMVLGLVLVLTSLQLAASQDGTNWFGVAMFAGTVTAFKAQSLYAAHKEKKVDVMTTHENSSVQTDKGYAVKELGHLLAQIVVKQQNQEGRLAQVEYEENLLSSCAEVSAASGAARKSPQCHMNFGLQDDQEIAAIVSSSNNFVDSVVRKSPSPVKSSSPKQVALGESSSELQVDSDDDDSVETMKATRTQTLLTDSSLHDVNGQCPVSSSYLHVIVSDNNNEK